MEVLYSRRASHTEAYELLAEAWTAAIQAGYAQEFKGIPPCTGDHEVLYVMAEEGDVIGVLTFEASKESAVYIISTAYVEPSSRRQGIFKAMLDTLFVRATKVGVMHVLCTLPLSNVEGLKTFTKVGAKSISTTLSLSVFE